MSTPFEEWGIEFQTTQGLDLRALVFRGFLRLRLSRQSSGSSTEPMLSRVLARDPELGFLPDGSWLPFRDVFGEHEAYKLQPPEVERILSYCRACEGLSDCSPRGPLFRPSSLAERTS